MGFYGKDGYSKGLSEVNMQGKANKVNRKPYFHLTPFVYLFLVLEDDGLFTGEGCVV